MARTDSDTVDAAWAGFREANGLPLGYQDAHHWSVSLGPLKLRLPNFAWRKRAIVAHDLHHLITGYPCTLRGECQVAAWEFGAGRFRHPMATLFCLPLLGLGCLISPLETWRAFHSGCESKSLHHQVLDEDFFKMPLEELKARVGDGKGGRKGLVLPYLLLVGTSTILISLPVLCAIGVVVTLLN